jgi:transcriptional regulator of heat shock response
MDERKQLILSAIINYFIEKAVPIGSKLLEEDFDISSATIRNDMSFLEKEGLIYQPYTSAGRVPTEVGYRFYVDKIIDDIQKNEGINEKFEQIKQEYFKKKVIANVYDVVAILSKATSNIAFATIPENKKTFYLGLANILKKPEFINNFSYASEVIEVLEEGFFTILNELNIDHKIRIYIGKENIISQMQSCSMLAVSYFDHGFKGIIGILGPMRMNYSYNKILLEYAKNMLNNE